MKGPGGRGEVEVAVSGVEGIKILNTVNCQWTSNTLLLKIIAEFVCVLASIYCVLSCSGLFFQCVCCSFTSLSSCEGL